MKYVILCFAIFFGHELIAQNIPNYIPQDSLLAWFPFNGNAKDQSGNGNHLTSFNFPNPDMDRMGNDSSAYSFDGDDSYLEAIIPFPSSFTISLWTKHNIGKLSNGSQNKETVFAYGKSKCDEAVLLNAKEGSSNFNFGAWCRTTTSGTYLDTNWHLLVVIFNGSSLKLIRDTTEIAFKNNVNLSANDSILMIGRNIRPYAEVWDGILDDVGFWNRTLSETEIKNIYLSEACTTTYSIDTIISCYQYKWTNGTTYTENNNTAKDTFESFLGCDSIVTLNLTINKSSEVNMGVSVCDSFITPSGKTYYTSGNFVDTLINHLGCDSFLIYKLDVVKTDAIITQQPKDANHYVGETAKFSVKSDNYPKATYQWQSDQGFGFQDLSNASQFSDVNTNTLSISDVRLINDKQKFRCVIFEQDCSDTTNEVTLYVTDNISVNNLINSDLVSVYPIPFNNELNIKISSLLVGSTYTLFDIRGTIIKSGIFDKETNRINLSNICKGTYYLNLDKLNKPFKVIK
jgi:hypothetical protein